MGAAERFVPRPIPPEASAAEFSRYGHPLCTHSYLWRAIRAGHRWDPGTGGRVLGSPGKEGRSIRAGLWRARLRELPRSQGRRDDDKGN